MLRALLLAPLAALTHAHAHAAGPHAHAHAAGPHAHAHAAGPHAHAHAAGPPALSASLFPLSAVALPADSRMAVQQARNSRYLFSLDSVRLACLYTAAANLTGTWAKPSCEPYDHPQYWGHYLGHWLSAAALSISSGSGGAALAAKADAMVATMADAQAAWTAAGEVGFLFPYANASSFAALAQGRNCAPVCVPFYIMHKMLAGLLDMHARTGNDQALTVATGVGNWVAGFVGGVLATGGEAAWQLALSTEWGGMNDALRNLFRATGDAKHAATAALFVHWQWTDPLVDRVDVLQMFHANTHIPEVIGDLNGFLLSGNTTQAAIVDNFLDILGENHSWATGGSNDHEYWGPSRLLGDSMNADTEETCTQYNLLKTLSMRFSLDSSARWADWYAKALYGGMIGNQAITGQWADTDSVGFHYMLPLGGGGLKKPWGGALRAQSVYLAPQQESLFFVHPFLLLPLWPSFPDRRFRTRFSLLLGELF
jgi:DUF1680 family protein